MTPKVIVGYFIFFHSLSSCSLFYLQLVAYVDIWYKVQFHSVQNENEDC